MLRAGVEIPLIPRYFDLLVLLIERRDEAVSRHDILDAVWSDVVVSDNALNQAIRSLRRAFEDDSRSPRFIATVARHGYRFVHVEVFEEPDEGALARARSDPPLPVSSDVRSEALAKLLDRDERLETRLEAAVHLHVAGTEQALRGIEGHPDHEVARALLRDARWDLPDAAPVPIWGTPGWLRSAGVLTTLRIRRAHAIAARRWAAAVMGGGLAGLMAGLLGGIVLRFGPASLAGNEGSRRGLALVVSGGIGGLLVGAAAHGLGAAVLAGLFGTELSAVAGGFEGMTIGAAVGLGYALATPRQEGGMASPRGRERLLVAASTGVACGLATATLGATGHFLGAMSLELLTQSFPGSQVGLAPLGRLLGEVPPGTLTAMAVRAWEGLWFGSGVAAGLTHRPQPTGRQGAESAS
jgi:DNA-binding winged helix-turn-helix (wHTH) protein